MATFEKQRFKQYLTRDKEFLRDIYMSESSYNTKRLLMFASDQKLNTLIKLLYFISNGEIRIRKADFEHFKKSQISFMKKNFEKKTAILRNLKNDREKKLKLLQKLSPILNKLTYPLFNSSNTVPKQT